MQRDFLSSGVIAAALVLSIIIVWVAILVPSHAAPLVRSDAKSGLGIAASIVSDTAQKGDRLEVGRSKIEYGAHSAPAAAAKAGARIPVGCDAAFSKSVRSGNVAVRCVTSTEPSVKFARATDQDRAL